MADKNYVPNSDEITSSEDEQPRNFQEEPGKNAEVTPTKKGKKKRKCPQMWKRNITKCLRNEGKEYVMRGKSKKIREARLLRQPCGNKCRLKCSKNISEGERQEIFDLYWDLKTIEKQRMFIGNATEPVKPKYRVIKEDNLKGPRKNNNAFYLKVGEKNVRVCKLFFKNTLDINDRNIRTVMEKKGKNATAIFDDDQRGKHKNHPTVDVEISNGIKEHIDNIPRVESHYIRADTTRSYIDGSRSLAEIHRDYVINCRENGRPYGNYPFFIEFSMNNITYHFLNPKRISVIHASFMKTLVRMRKKI